MHSLKRPTALSLPAVNVAQKVRDVELGQAAARAAFANRVRVTTRGTRDKHPRLK